MIVEATTPTRIDFAGSTLDLYPLYLFVGGGITVNAAVDLYCTVRVETRSDPKILLRSLDRNEELVASSVEQLPMDQELSLVARVVKSYPPKTGVNVITKSSAPQGSGIGASSSLLIALSGAMDRINGTSLDPSSFVEYGANIEAQVIAIPTGKQDYLAALYGSVNAFHFGVRGWRRERLITDLGKLRQFEERIVLSFTGESHFSGTNNWVMIKNFVENASGSRHSMYGIQGTAERMREAVLDFDLGRVAELLDEEWESRKQLADGVTTARIDRLMEAAKQGGGLASKIMGAGGGGCMITIAESGRRQGVEAALEDAGATVLPFRIAREGLSVREL